MRAIRHRGRWALRTCTRRRSRRPSGTQRWMMTRFARQQRARGEVDALRNDGSRVERGGPGGIPESHGVAQRTLDEAGVGLYKTGASATAPRSGTGRSAASPTWRTSPRRGWPGTTRQGSSTDSGDARLRRPRPGTTLDCTPESTPVTRNEVCMKPGMLHDVPAAGTARTPSALADGLACRRLRPRRRLRRYLVSQLALTDQGQLVLGEQNLDATGTWRSGRLA